MLVDLTRRPSEMSPILAAIGDGQPWQRVQRGVYVLGHWNPEHEVRERLGGVMAIDYRAENFSEHYAQRKREMLDVGFAIPVCKIQDEYGADDDDQTMVPFPENGVVDSPEQLLELVDLDALPIPVAVTMVEIQRGDQPSSGGWRYHKWGPYLGTQNPQHEYLHDDTHIERVFTYHIYRVSPPEAENHAPPPTPTEPAGQGSS